MNSDTPNQMITSWALQKYLIRATDCTWLLPERLLDGFQKALAGPTKKVNLERVLTRAKPWRNVQAAPSSAAPRSLI